MKLTRPSARRARIEMLPLIDIVFLLLVVFIYAMLSMAVHRGLPVALPESSSAVVERENVLALTVRGDGTIFVEKEAVALEDLVMVLGQRTGVSGVLLFADQQLSYQQLFRVLDRVKEAGVERISLQARDEGGE